MPVDNAAVANDQGGLNWKIFTDVPISSANLSMQNAVSRQQRADQAADSVHENAMNAAQQIAQLAAKSALQMSDNTAMLAQAMTGRVSRHILDLSAEQAVGFAKELSADLSSKLADISGQLASVQEMAKIAQTTPPETGQTGQNALLAQLASIDALLRAQASRGTTP